jgi:hypothetical protein
LASPALVQARRRRAPLNWLLFSLLGVWRVTHLLVAEDGRWDISFRLGQTARLR